MSNQRNYGLADVCPCGATAQEAGRQWTLHTSRCPQWQSKRRRLLEGTTTTTTAQQSNPAADVLEAPGSANENTLDDMSQEILAPHPTIVASSGLQLTIRLPPTLRRLGPPPPVDTPPIGPEAQVVCEDEVEPSPLAPHTSRLLIWRITMPNAFGVYRRYLVRPGQVLAIPDLAVAVQYHCQPSLTQPPPLAVPVSDIIYPFPNTSTFRLAHWFFTGSERKSTAERIRLVRNVILAPDFSPEHFLGQNLDALDRALDTLDSAPSLYGNPAFDSTQNFSDGWRSHKITLVVPIPRSGRKAPATSSNPPNRSRQGMYASNSVPSSHSDSQLSSGTSAQLKNQNATEPVHFIPFQQFCRPPGSNADERLYDELYTTDAWLREHQRLQQLPPVPGCKLERVIIALMFSSDATHLAQFSLAYLWPIYLYFGNNSKWDRRKPSSRVCQHIAYIPKLSDALKSSAAQSIRSKVTPSLLAHLKRELFHACWRILLDDEFLEAYRHGIPLRCADGVERRLYPRIFTYSADYPEKTLIATIKDFGNFPCPHCLIPKAKISQLGLKSDDAIRNNRRKDDNNQKQLVTQARKLIYGDGYVVNSKHVSDILFETSAVPTLNAFSDRLREFGGVDMYEMLTPDLLHEFELGVWKSVLTHLIRMLATLRTDAVETFDSRFREITTFGSDTIRKFRHNVSAMRKFAARDFEDVLQCCIPCIQGLFPAPDDEEITTLLFTLAQWHALAKLRVQTPTTLDHLRAQTAALGRRLRRFEKEITPRYATVETDQEFELRSRREARELIRRRTETTNSTRQDTTRRQTGFSLKTYKLHVLGGYVDAIRTFGTTDSYSTQISELEHRRAKAKARRTNLVNVVKDINKLDRREVHLNRRAEQLAEAQASEQASTNLGSDVMPEPNSNELEAEEDDSNGTPPALSERYYIGERGTRIYLAHFLSSRANDPAIQDFVLNLKNHILFRLHSSSAIASQSEQPFSDDERRHVSIPSGVIFQHATMGVRYTTYDIRRGQDTINPRSNHHFVMVNADHDSDHPYWEERTPNRFAASSFGIGYSTGHSLSATYGFINPASVIRASHLIPAFHYGRGRSSTELQFIGSDGTEGDWESYYVSRFVDRDMVARYLGFGPGHLRQNSVLTDGIPPTDQDPPEEVEEEEEMRDEEEIPEVEDESEPIVSLSDSDETDSDSESEDMYTGDAPLLRLLNRISKQIFESRGDPEALIFRSADQLKVFNPFTGRDFSPDLVALWEHPQGQDFPQIDYTQDFPIPPTWCAFAAVGEAKTGGNGKNQLGAYLKNHLQLHPELNAVLGLGANKTEYVLCYHDADVIDRSVFNWKQPGPLYAFIKKLYTRPFRDTSMHLIAPQNPDLAWVIKVGNHIYISQAPRSLAGPGQRRFTTPAIEIDTGVRVFIKDIWWNVERAFLEGLLFEQAHREWALPGLMVVDSHGFVLDENRERLTTAGPDRGRHKMRLVTKDIGRPLETVRSLRQFLCVMYDACVVQRNLYRKCCILHRDISDSNIMVAPAGDEYHKRCEGTGSHVEVKFVNQVLQKDGKEPDPAPECMVIDLGNGADLKIARKNDELTDRTGTPKFIARSVSSGELLESDDYSSENVSLPSPPEIRDYVHRMHTTEYQRDIPPTPNSTAQPEAKFAHQLFHDAESTFWVIVWTLVRSTSGNREEKPHTKEYSDFYHTMCRHYPQPGEEDDRGSVLRKSLKYWTSLLHPGLKKMAPMLRGMIFYVWPEWGLSQAFDPEHVHEALMRLLLVEIIKLDSNDIVLDIGARSAPLASLCTLPLPGNSGSRSISQRSLSRNNTTNPPIPNDSS
ncbi:Patatin-like phospholipase domain-containing protein 7 [Rhizoctonia solani]|uniref:Patatin-like phospholipase domain-containing protein 7 n=1 Tax=Rhizoctonia solani TaxID=456999 RepID=A0A0K6FRA7_9AGAM|nr:Patatin-like phospholipase domain-containing protein 7 [Rhizoctonia solani]